MLNREQLRQRTEPRRYRLVPLPGGDDVRIRSLTRAEQREWRKSARRKDGDVDPKRMAYSDDVLLAMVIVDANGDTVFTPQEALDGIFDDWDSGTLTTLIAAAVDHCRLVVDATRLEDALKNCEETPGNDSCGV